MLPVLQPFLASFARWYTPATAQGRLGWQMTLNSTMLSVLIFLHPFPWGALLAMLGLLAATVWLHGRGSLGLLALFGGLGWVGEVWMTWLGGVWRHAAPVECGVLCGGWLGVPFFMAPAWALVGALMLALVGYMMPKLRA
ncbi:MAG: hypothetical protein INF43_04970 [Alphaproteobacteria bacterium]|nr:hypothetical protein [Alphaproteobacteria bacterium]